MHVISQLRALATLHSNEVPPVPIQKELVWIFWTTEKSNHTPLAVQSIA